MNQHANQAILNFMEDVTVAYKAQDFNLLMNLRTIMVDHTPVEIDDEVRDAIIKVVDILLDGLSQMQEVENVR